MSAARRFEARDLEVPAVSTLGRGGVSENASPQPPARMVQMDRTMSPTPRELHDAVRGPLMHTMVRYERSVGFGSSGQKVCSDAP